jgi:hypothetical protein
MKSIMEATTILLGTQLIPLFLFSLSALACAPAPTCWMGSSREYLKSVCINSTRSPDMLKYVEEPEQIGNFVQAWPSWASKSKLRPVRRPPLRDRSIATNRQQRRNAIIVGPTAAIQRRAAGLIDVSRPFQLICSFSRRLNCAPKARKN